MPAQPFEEMMKTWMDAQKKMWDSFLNAMPDAGKSEAAKAWEQLVTNGEQTLKTTFQGQSELIQAWVKSATTMEGTPTAFVESAKQFQETYTRWSEAQQQLWTNWFEMLKKFDPTKGMSAWPGMPANPYQIWQEETRKMLDRQFEWMRSWMGSVKQ